MNQIAVCPRCRAWLLSPAVRLPSEPRDLSDAATVPPSEAHVATPHNLRCPRCGNIVSHAELNWTELLVFETTAEALTPSVAHESAPPASRDAMLEDLPELVPQTPRPAVHVNVAPPSAAPARVPPLQAANGGRRRRPPQQPLWELVKIVGGGAAGLLLAQLILWWLPGQWRRDPLQLAPRVPAMLQFVLPRSLQTPDFARLPQEFDVPPRDNGESSEVPDARWYFEATEHGGLDDDPKPNGIDDRLSSASSALHDTSEGSMPSNDVETSPLAVAEAPEMEQRLATIQTDWQQWKQLATNTSVGNERLEIARHFYRHLAELADFLNRVDESSSTENDATRQPIELLLEQLAKDREVLDLVGHAASSWLTSKERQSPGIALVGELLSDPAGRDATPPSGIGQRIDIGLVGRPGDRVTLLMPATISWQANAEAVGRRWLVLGIIEPTSVAAGNGSGDATYPLVRYLSHAPISDEVLPQSPGSTPRD